MDFREFAEIKQYEPFFGAWYITRALGEGSYGRVYEIERSTDASSSYQMHAALKIIRIPRSESERRALGMNQEDTTAYLRNLKDRMLQEIEVMEQLTGNSNIVSYEDHMVIEHPDHAGWDILIRMELLTPVQTVLSEAPYTENTILDLGIGLCRALELCERSQILHRDIKPDNIFYSKNKEFKLGDFGVARIFDNAASGLTARMGTNNYMAPEVYNGRAYDYRSDLYSVGLVMYRYLNNNRLPFIPETPIVESVEHAFTRRMQGEQLPPPCNASKPAAMAILKACAPNPADRYASAAEMRRALETLPRQSAPEEFRLAVAAPVAAPKPQEAMTAGAKDRRTTPIHALLAKDESRPLTLPDDSASRASEPPAPAQRQAEQSNEIRSSAAPMVAAQDGTEDWAKAEPQKKKLPLLPILLAVVVLAAGTVLGFTLRRSAKNAPADAAAPAETATFAADEEILTDEDGAAFVAVEVAKMPDCLGGTEKEAREKLKAAGVSNIRVVGEASGKPAGTVLSQFPDAAEEIPEDAVVILTVATAAQTAGATQAQGNEKAANAATAAAAPQVILPDAVTLSQGAMTLTVGASQHLGVTSYTPANTTDQTIYFTSTNYDVAYPDSQNDVCARMTGRATIEAHRSDGKVVARCTVTVVAPITTTAARATPAAITTTARAAVPAEPATPAAPVMRTVKLNANGGTVSPASLRVEDGDTASLPTPQRDYYTFDGWYTTASGGTKYTNSTAINSNLTLYAHWSENAVSGWVRDSAVPAGAQIVNTKYKFTHRYYKTDSAASLSGWTLQKSERTGWGAMQGPVDSDPSNGSRNVTKKTETYVSGKKTVYKYYHTRNDAGVYSNDQWAPNATERMHHRIELDSPLSYKRTGSTGIRWHGTYSCPVCGNEGKDMWFPDGTYQKDVTSTRTKYYYQEPIYTYYYYQDRTEESETRPGGSDYSNIETWVQYRAK